MKEINFTKMVASGNDFVVVDNRNHVMQDKILPAAARKFCDRRYGIGADGLLLLEKSKKAHFKMRIFNPDGSEPSMCGNGLRCILLYAHKKGIAKNNIVVQTKAGVLRGQIIKEKEVKTTMINPKGIMLDLHLALHGRQHAVSFINTGVPHVVSFVKDLNSISVARVGAGIRYHKAFEPHGTNVNFVKILDKKNIRIRTYERGVEAETLACGSGATASAIIFALKENTTSPVNVHTKSTEVLKVYFDILKDGKVVNVYLEGPANFVFNGRINKNV